MTGVHNDVIVVVTNRRHLFGAAGLSHLPRVSASRQDTQLSTRVLRGLSGKTSRLVRIV